MTPLRSEWIEAKQKLNADVEEKARIEQLIKTQGMGISIWSFYFTYLRIKSLGWPGIPYADYKTFKAWNAEGRRIKAGEKSAIKGVTWISAGKGDEEDAPLFPKEYHLFGRHQLV
jgi:hypothetical protein